MFHLIRGVLDNFGAGAPFWPVLCSGIDKALRLSGFAMEIDRCGMLFRAGSYARTALPAALSRFVEVHIDTRIILKSLSVLEDLENDR